jgi:hypothetical protein
MLAHPVAIKATHRVIAIMRDVTRNLLVMPSRRREGNGLAVPDPARGQGFITKRTTQLGQRCKRFTRSGFFPGLPAAIRGRD